MCSHPEWIKAFSNLFRCRACNIWKFIDPETKQERMNYDLKTASDRPKEEVE